MRDQRAVFARRRRAFLDRLDAGAAALLCAAPVSVRSNDVEYRYRQDSDFYYLTGLAEPGAVAVLLPGNGDEEFILFVSPRDPEREVWVGARTGVEEATAQYGADRAYPIDQLDAYMRRCLADRERVYIGTGRDETFARRVLGWMHEWGQARARSGTGPVGLMDAGTVLHEMRLRKTVEEIELMRRACAISAQAHAAAMAERRPGMREYVIEALLEYTFRRCGASGPAYPSIVASGPNAAVLHYAGNDREMRAGDLILVDAGAECECYAADVTRTYPVGGSFNGPQRALYDVVSGAQHEAVAAIAPGVTVDEVHRCALRVLIEGLNTLGLLHAGTDEALEKELYRPFFMHRTSHWLGMDVHDVGGYKLNGRSRTLEPGMVMTVEPGIYVSPVNEEVDTRWRGIGVRIEDDVLVTMSGCEVLSSGVPKLPEDIQ